MNLNGTSALDAWAATTWNGHKALGKPQHDLRRQMSQKLSHKSRSESGNQAAHTAGTGDRHQWDLREVEMDKAVTGEMGYIQGPLTKSARYQRWSDTGIEAYAMYFENKAENPVRKTGSCFIAYSVNS